MTPWTNNPFWVVWVKKSKLPKIILNVFQHNFQQVMSNFSFKPMTQKLGLCCYEVNDNYLILRIQSVKVGMKSTLWAVSIVRDAFTRASHNFPILELLD